MILLLAPMEGLLDFVLRDILTRAGGVDRCVSEFIRVTDRQLPKHVFTRIVPELLHGGRTLAGVPVRPQLLGSDPACLADNAAVLGGFPSRESFAILKRDRVRYAVFHLDLFDPPARLDVLARLREFDRYLVRHYGDERTWLFEIVGAPP